ncbi:tetratricopeptide repeat protein [Desulfobulbus oralis]|uniref:Uncharacterized protein n=1 Tax=Desulfobulbus oralis TaxID=1986146 RepID=A0A2L1GPA6_9BACT|nr:tetratricopeptide repeat protein [Desulfobulbus oralis]AVD71466.1 hypothetical protein CAY53_08305 [Desulfobulbus oralis]
MITHTNKVAVLPDPDIPELLRPEDFQLLARPFLKAIAFLFPPSLELDFLPADAPPQEADDSHFCLLLPLQAEGREEPLATLRLQTADKKLVKMLKDDWLLAQAASVVHILTHLRPAFVDAQTGLYNLHALNCTLANGAMFFLVQMGGMRRNLSESLQSCEECARLLRQHADGALFSCGYGLFGVLKKGEENESGPGSARRGARLLQRRLRQEGLRRVQIVYLDAARARSIIAESGLGGFQECLTSADRQGPFGLICGSGPIERRTRRFRLADNEVFHHLQRKWQGQRSFAIAIFRLAIAPEGPSYVWVSQVELKKNIPVLWMDDERTLVCFFPGMAPAEVADRAEQIRTALHEELPDVPIAVGIAGYPCLDYPKRATPANCFKALLHASLLGPGQLVLFDHLTLNVSGDSFFEEGDYHQAIQEYRRGLRLKADDVNLLNSLGVTLGAYGQETQAAECFRRLLALDANNHMALANLGYILLRKGKNAEALAKLELARTVFPASEPLPRELLKSLVQLYLERQREDLALEVLEDWDKLRADSGDDDALYHRQLGLALKGAGQNGKAIRAFEQAMKLAPQDAIALAHLGALYRLHGEGPELGLHFCQQAVRLKWDDAELWHILGDCYLDCGSLDAATRAARQCLRLDPANARGMWLAAQINVQKKNPSQARYWLNRIRKLHTITWEFRESIARALAGLPSTKSGRKSAPAKRAGSRKTGQ